MGTLPALRHVRSTRIRRQVEAQAGGHAANHWRPAERGGGEVRLLSINEESNEQEADMERLDLAMGGAADRAAASSHSDPAHGCRPRWFILGVGRYWLVGDELICLANHDGRDWFVLFRSRRFETHFAASEDYVLDTIEDRVRRAGGGRLDVLRACRRVGRKSVMSYFGLQEATCSAAIARLVPAR